MLLYMDILCYQFGMMETIIVGVTDRFPDSLGQHRIKFVLVCCVVGFLLGLPLTTKVSTSFLLATKKHDIFLFVYEPIELLRIIPTPREKTLVESSVTPASDFENGGFMSNKLTNCQIASVKFDEVFEWE